MDCRTHHSLAEPLPSTGQGLGEPQLQGARLPPPCLDPPHAAKALQSRMMFPDRVLVPAPAERRIQSSSTRAVAISSAVPDTSASAPQDQNECWPVTPRT